MNEERIKELENRKSKQRSHHSMERNGKGKRAREDRKRSEEREKSGTPVSKILIK